MALAAGQIIRAADLTPTEWQPVSFENGWSNLGVGYHDVEFRYLPWLGDIQLRGAMTGGTLTGGTTVFTMPEGYRPSAMSSAVVGSLTAGSSDPRLLFRPDGDVEIYGMSDSSAGSCGLEGVFIHIG